ncbi:MULTISPECIES: hypothetical protein [Tsukamurella]|uniref:Uncharacterized protein n=1 Tax=Tsukamurella strandjordii TaxID=147577 RepID=A0AA90NAN5_9ACTN|nr:MULTISPECIES: hypothetical protein [Tsukamurella]MDP0397002.1 hypothetical protein [Tsukamurella strandjordii]GIZ96803.1 hypothetical protein TTY48_14150 [Tsukamurella sp. TY48]
MSDLSWPAARILGRAAIRGHLELSDTHLRFRPAGMAAKLQGTPFAVQLRHLAGAGVTETSGGFLRRGRQRLCVTLGDASEQVFDIPRPDDVAATIRERIPGAAA